MSCDTITPISAFQSTNLNSKIDSFHRLGERIVRSLGAPLVSVEVSQDQLYENISIACEMFSKFAGFTKDYLIFDSALYERGKGIRIDTLYTLANNLLTLEEKIKHKTESVSTATYLSKPDSVYIVSCPISDILVSTVSAISAISVNGFHKNQILDKSTYSFLVSSIQFPTYFSYTPSIYTTLTAYHTTQNPIPSSVFAASSSLSSKYSSGIAYNVDILDSTDYSQISSYRNSYNINNFFKSELTNYYTGSATLLNDIPASVFANNTVLSSTINKKLSVNELISDSNYSLISNNLTSIPVENYFDTSFLSTYAISVELSSNVWQDYPLLSSFTNLYVNDIITKNFINTVESTIGIGFPLSSFVQNPHLTVPDNILVYDVVNSISSGLLLSNTDLSAQFGLGISRGAVLSASEYDLLSTYQPNIPFTNNYDLSSITTVKTCNTNVLSNILSPYQTLSSTYVSGLSVGLALLPNQYNQIQNETNGYFNINLFFNNVSSTRYVFTNTNVLCANTFANSTILSSIYPNGINLNRTMLANEYNILSSNFDFSINNFYKPTIKTTLRTDPYYTAIEHVPSSVFEMTALSSTYLNGIEVGTVLNGSTYNILNSIITDPLKTYFCESRIAGVSNSCESHCTSDSKIFNNMFDYDIMDYRKVIAITDFEEGTSAGLNTLFTIEQTLAQQTYFSYAMGNYGFDLISWWTVKNWLETREKVLALRRSYEFDDRTQYLRLYPEPTNAVRFYGVFPAYVERPLRDIIKELWVYKYSLALTKINVGLVRGKLGSTSVLGGQIFSQDLIQQGITERDALEQQLYTTSAGLGDSDPVTFFIG
jgi:hypothetical protein